jgi:gluconolactonase
MSHIRIFCLLMASVFLGSSGVVFAHVACANLDSSSLLMDLPCVVSRGTTWSVTLIPEFNPKGEVGAWHADRNSIEQADFAPDNKACAVLNGSTNDLKLNCVLSHGKVWQAQLAAKYPGSKQLIWYLESYGPGDSQGEGAREFRQVDPEFAEVLGDNFSLSIVVEANAHEGPVYVVSENTLYFTSTPAETHRGLNVTVSKLELNGDQPPYYNAVVSVIRDPSNLANGMTLSLDGALLICEQGTMDEAARISRLDIGTLQADTVVDAFAGLPLNSPNDIVIKSDGTIWFTDPSYGFLQDIKPFPLVGDNVYRYDPETEEIIVVAGSFNKPNGLAFSPDESILYINDSGAIQTPGSFFDNLPHQVRAYNVNEGGVLTSNGVVWDVSPGIPDGMKVDAAGRVYTSSATGVQVFRPNGDLLGEIFVKGVANFTFGGPNNDQLFMLNDTEIWVATLGVQGAL